MRLLSAVVMLVWAGACAARAAAPPSIVVDRSACSRCGMLISERAYAAAIRWHDGREQLFDDIGCLVASAGEQSQGERRYWFHDAGDGQWIEGANPTFVASTALRTPMGGGIVAYRDRGAAEAAAARQAGQIVTDVSALVAWAGGSR